MIKMKPPTAEQIAEMRKRQEKEKRELDAAQSRLEIGAIIALKNARKNRRTKPKTLHELILEAHETVQTQERFLKTAPTPQIRIQIRQKLNTAVKFRKLRLDSLQKLDRKKHGIMLKTLGLKKVYGQYKNA
ncbi:MAG: hypothetical protein ACPGNV_13745 [Mangrovicoccus sp.]